LNEERFTSAFTGGKLRQNQWGKVKIQMGLAQKGISREKADEAISQLDQDQYRAQLQALLEKHWNGMLKHLPPLEARAKLYRAGLSRGFESSLVGELVKQIIKGIPLDAPEPEE
jgi:regulatory protein